MPKLDNAKHEKFAQEVALGMSAAEAYIKYVSEGNCSDATAETAGPRLARDVQVSIRIVDLKGRLSESAEKKFNLTKDKWLERLVTIADKAEEAEDFSAATGALDKIGKATDFYTPVKVEHTGTIVHEHAFDNVMASIIQSGSPIARQLSKERDVTPEKE